MDAVVITHCFDSAKQNKNKKYALFFSNKSKDEQLLILNQTLNNIQVFEK